MSDVDDIPVLTLEKGDARGGKYYRRVATGNPKHPWRYFYTREEYEREHGDQAHRSGPDTSRARLYNRAKSMVESGTNVVTMGGYELIEAARGAKAARDMKTMNGMANQIMHALSHGHPSLNSPANADSLARRAWKILNPGSTDDDVRSAIDSNRGISSAPPSERPTRAAVQQIADEQKKSFVISADLLKAGERAGHKYLSRKPDGKGGWQYVYGETHEHEDGHEKIKPKLTKTKYKPALRSGRGEEQDISAHGDFGTQKGSHGHYDVVHLPSGYIAGSGGSKAEAEALVHHYATHPDAQGIGENPSKEEGSKLFSVKQKFKFRGKGAVNQSDEDRKADEKKRDQENYEREASRGSSNERQMHYYAEVFHRKHGEHPKGYDPDTHPKRKRELAERALNALESRHDRLSTQHQHKHGMKAHPLDVHLNQAIVSHRSAQELLRHGIKYDQVHQHLADAHAALDKLEQGHKEQSSSPEETKKSLQEMNIMESTPELREQIKMLLNQEDPLAKGIYQFEPSYGQKSVRKLPDEYLAAYLDAFIEAAFENEKREKAHDIDQALVGIHQPMVSGPNGGDGFDEADFYAQFVMNCLVTYIVKNENLERACSKTNCNKAYIADRLREMGLCKPRLDGGVNRGNFMQGYMYSEEQQTAANDSFKSMAAATFPTEEELTKSYERNQQILAERHETIRLSDEAGPLEQLSGAWKNQHARIRNFFGFDD